MEGKGREALTPLILNVASVPLSLKEESVWQVHHVLQLQEASLTHMQSRTAWGCAVHNLHSCTSALRESSVVVVVVLVLVVWLGGVWGGTEVSNTVAWLNQ